VGGNKVKHGAGERGGGGDGFVGHSSSGKRDKKRGIRGQ